MAQSLLLMRPLSDLAAARCGSALFRRPLFIFCSFHQLNGTFFFTNRCDSSVHCKFLLHVIGSSSLVQRFPGKYVAHSSSLDSLEDLTFSANSFLWRVKGKEMKRDLQVFLLVAQVSKSGTGKKKPSWLVFSSGPDSE